MARSDAQGLRQEARARQALATALERGDLDSGLAAYFILPNAERAPSLDALAGLLANEAAQARLKKNWSRLGFLAARCEREPGLLSNLDPASRSEARWALLWGAVGAKEWRRAREHLGALRSGLDAGAPSLRQWLDDLAAREGRSTATLEGSATAIESHRRERERMGYTQPRPQAPAFDTGTSTRGSRVGPASPASRLGATERLPAAPIRLPAAPSEVALVPAQVLGCRAEHAWPRFEEISAAWIASSPAEIAQSIRRMCVGLAIREHLHGLAGAPQGAIRTVSGNMLRVATRCVLDAGAPPELEEETWLAFRLVLAQCPTTGPSDDTARALVLCAQAASRYPALKALVAECICALPVQEAAHKALVPFLEEMCGQAPSLPYLEKAIRVVGMPAGPRIAPKWLDRALTVLLADPEGFSRWFAALEPERWIQNLKAATKIFAEGPLQGLLDVLWAGADPARRGLLSEEIHHLIESVQGAPKASAFGGKLPRSLESLLLEELRMGVGYDASIADLRRLLYETPPGQELLADFLGSDRPKLPEPNQLRPQARGIWERFRDRVLPVDARFLDMALRGAQKPADTEAALGAFLAGRKDILAQLDAVARADQQGCRLAASRLANRLAATLAQDVEALAKALLRACQDQMDEDVAKVFALALRGAYDRDPTAQYSNNVYVALDEADFFLPRRRKPRTKKPAVKKKKKLEKTENSGKATRASGGAERESASTAPPSGAPPSGAPPTRLPPERAPRRRRTKVAANETAAVPSSGADADRSHSPSTDPAAREGPSAAPILPVQIDLFTPPKGRL